MALPIIVYPLAAAAAVGALLLRKKHEDDAARVAANTAAAKGSAPVTPAIQSVLTQATAVLQANPQAVTVQGATPAGNAALDALNATAQQTADALAAAKAAAAIAPNAVNLAAVNQAAIDNSAATAAQDQADPNGQAIPQGS